MALVMRLYDFVDGTKIIPAHIDAEFSNLVDMLSGITSIRHAHVKFSDTTIPTMILDQLGSGPCLVGRAIGSEVFSVKSNGDITGKKFSSNLATGTAPLVVSSTTVTPNLNAGQVDGLDIASKVVKTSLLGQVVVDNFLATDSILSSNVGTSNPPTDIAHLTRKDYVDGKKAILVINLYFKRPFDSSEKIAAELTRGNWFTNGATVKKIKEVHSTNVGDGTNHADIVISEGSIGLIGTLRDSFHPIDTVRTLWTGSRDVASFINNDFYCLLGNPDMCGCDDIVVSIEVETTLGGYVGA